MWKGNHSKLDWTDFYYDGNGEVDGLSDLFDDEEERLLRELDMDEELFYEQFIKNYID